MPEPDLIQQQRAMLRAFRLATAERNQSEADAEARRKTGAGAAQISSETCSHVGEAWCRN
jgi:hypothetical protein